jgi:hypothetical protein
MYHGSLCEADVDTLHDKIIDLNDP